MSTSRCFDIQSFGAVPDGETLNTAAIQKAIDACHEAGGGQVYCGPGEYLTGSLVLKSNVELHVAAGCRLVGSTSLDDYEELRAAGFRTEYAPERSAQSLVRAVEAENVAITGPGELDGSGLAFYDTEKISGRFFAKPGTPRPRLVMFYRCRNVCFEDTSFIDSPCWTIWLMKCEQVRIHRVRVIGDQRMINNDGIDLDSCRDVVVSDCIIRTADDCLVLRALGRVYEEPGICENVTISNCVLDSYCQGVRVGCPGDNIVRNCTVSGLVISSASNGIVFDNPRRYLPEGTTGNADVRRISFSNVVINCERVPIKVTVEDGIKLPGLAELSFSDFRIRSGEPCRVEGNPETIIRDVSFNNVRIDTYGDQAIVSRYCEDVRLNNVVLSNLKEA